MRPRSRLGVRQGPRRDQQNLEETEYLTREIASLRIALREVATRDFVRSELKDMLEEIVEMQQQEKKNEAAPENDEQENQRKDREVKLVKDLDEDEEPIEKK